MSDLRSSVSPPRISRGAREILTAWVLFGAGGFATLASPWSGPLAGSLSSLCFLVGLILMMVGIAKQLFSSLELRLMAIEQALQTPSETRPQAPARRPAGAFPKASAAPARWP